MTNEPIPQPTHTQPRFATTAQSFGVIPLFNGGDALLQPTYVSDVVDAIVKLVEEGVRWQ